MLSHPQSVLLTILEEAIVNNTDGDLINNAKEFELDKVVVYKAY